MYIVFWRIAIRKKKNSQFLIFRHLHLKPDLPYHFPPIQVCNCDAVLWFWATYESAQYCLLARLRTPLGMPAETFTAIESNAHYVYLFVFMHILALTHITMYIFLRKLLYFHVLFLFDISKTYIILLCQ